MKKIFTLIAAVCVALTVNAQDEEGVLKLDSINCGLPADGVVTAWSWNQQSTNNSVSHQDPTTGEWITDKEATYDYKDASAYDFIVVKFEKNETGGNFICVDSSWQKQIATAFVAKADYVAVDLATSDVSSFKDNIVCFVMQPGADGILKIAEVDYMTKAAFEAYKESVEKTEKTYDFALPGANGVVAMNGEEEGGSGWHDAGWIGMGDLASLYKTFVVEFKAEHEFRLCAQNMVYSEEDGYWVATDQVEKFAKGTDGETKIIAYTIGEGKDLQGLGQYAITNKYITEYYEPSVDPKTGEKKDESIYGDNTVTVVRAYLTNQEVESTYTPWEDPHATGIKDVKAETSESNVMYNVAGQRVSNAKGLIIKKGKKILAD